MHTASTLALILPALATAYPSSIFPRQNSTCAPLHIISARGSTEDPGEGTTLAPVSAQIRAQIAGADTTALDYPAGIVDPEYMISESEGTTNLAADLMSYADQCGSSGSKIALLGFSQGAQVVMDTLCGTDELLFKDSPPETAQTVVDMLSSAVAFGDPSHIAGLSYDRGNGTKNGVFPRLDPGACDPFATIIRNYCNDGDPFCDSGDDLDAHVDGAYVRAHGDDAVTWVVSNFNGNPTG